MGRRKRILRDSLPADDEGALGTPVRARTRRDATGELEEDDEPQRRRSAGYSQDVRSACQHRLVQLIPVRRRAYLLSIIASCLVPALLLLTHYWIYVNGYLKWYGQPLAVLLDASHPRGIAAWMTGQMWLLCLASTVLTFRLRRHKLDDYKGDYRLWFWLVTTCIIGSLDSTTRVTDVFGDALDRWSQQNLGWSGPAVVQATLATLVGMLGLRLCSELKTVPTSLMFWLLGLVAWAGSAALGQEMLKLEMSLQFRIWLRSALWIGGLTSIWIASLSYLRAVYIEAQRRFLLRGRLSVSLSSTWKERLTESMPAMPRMPSFRLRRPADEEPEEGRASLKRKERTDAPEKRLRRFGLPSFMKRKQPLVTDEETSQASVRSRTQEQRAEQRSEQPKATQRDAQQASPSRTEQRPVTQAAGPLTSVRRPEANKVPSSASREPISNASASQDSNKVASKDANKHQPAQSDGRRSWLGRLVGSPKAADDAAENRKLEKAARTAAQSAAKKEALRLKEEQRQAQKVAVASGKADAPSQAAKKRRWLPMLSIPKTRMPTLPRLKMPKIGLPKLKLPSLRLPPPESSGTSGTSGTRVTSKPEIRPLASGKPLPSTSGSAQEGLASGGRPLSKAERKRMRRIQDDQDYDAEERRAA